MMLHPDMSDDVLSLSMFWAGLMMVFTPLIAALQFLCHQSVLHVPHSRAAIALQRRTKESQFRHRFDEFAGKSASSVAFFDDGNQIVLNELPRGVADEPFLVSEQRIILDEIDTAKFDGRHEIFPR
jgi:hypothetical protein